MASRKRMGRPPKPPEQVRGEHVGVRLTREERAALEYAAEQAGQELSQYVREAALAYALNRAKPRNKRRRGAT